MERTSSLGEDLQKLQVHGLATRLLKRQGANRFAINKEDKMSSLKTYDREDCSAGFQAGESGNPRGVKQRVQNERAGKSNETAKKNSGFEMRKNARGQNEPVRDKGLKPSGRPIWPPTRITNHSIGKGGV
jgi:hypothetical protein